MVPKSPSLAVKALEQVVNHASYHCRRALCVASSGLVVNEADRKAPQKVFLETHGCQMNLSDSEVVLSILAQHNLQQTSRREEADVILLNTCAIREQAEAKIWAGYITSGQAASTASTSKAPVVGVLGCMAERLKDKLLHADRLADIVVGPDAYRDLPRLIAAVQDGRAAAATDSGPAAGSGSASLTAMNVQLSLEETYADVRPLRPAGQVSAFISIMRGCNNMCTFCVVPFTRGRERSRPVASILQDVRELSARGVKEVMLLGQNVNSYADFSERDAAVGADAASDVAVDATAHSPHASTSTAASSGECNTADAAAAARQDRMHSHNSASSSAPAVAAIPHGAPFNATGTRTGAAAAVHAASHRSAHAAAFDPYAAYAPGFRSIYKPQRDGAVGFAELLQRVAAVDPEMRVRFTSPHPKEFSDDVLQVIAAHPNICKQLHMPAQSGSSTVLERMRRGYSREAYDALVRRARQLLPTVALSTDIIVGFCGETPQEHQQTLELLDNTGYDNAFLFAYSERAKTLAARHLPDDVPTEVKQARLQEVMALYKRRLAELNRRELGAVHLVLVEGRSKKSDAAWVGKSCTGKKLVFADSPLPGSLAHVAAAASSDTSAADVASSSCRNASPDGRHTPLAADMGDDCNGSSKAAVDIVPGDYVAVRVTGCHESTLLGRPLARTTLHEFVGEYGGTVVVPLIAQSHEGTDCNVEDMQACG